MNHSLQSSGEWEYYEAGIRALDRRINHLKKEETKLRKQNHENLPLGNFF